MARTLFSLLFLLSATAVSDAEIPRTEVSSSPDVITLQYDPVDGYLRADPGGLTLTSIEISSASIHPFVGPNPPCMEGIIFDVHPFPRKLFCLKTDGFKGRDYDFGTVMIPGLDGASLGADLTVRGSVLPSGRIPAAAFYIVPEPSAALLATLATLLTMPTKYRVRPAVGPVRGRKGVPRTRRMRG